jgi:hypothetical protein
MNLPTKKETAFLLNTCFSKNITEQDLTLRVFDIRLDHVLDDADRQSQYNTHSIDIGSGYPSVMPLNSLYFGFVRTTKGNNAKIFCKGRLIFDCTTQGDSDPLTPMFLDEIKQQSAAMSFYGYEVNQK